MQIETCKSCGGIIERRGNYYVCQSCGNKWVIDADNDVHVIDRANAWSALRDCDFERASELFETIIFKEPKNHEAYWGRALAGAGIIYVSDLNENKKVPTCNSISEDSFINNSDVKKAIDLAPAEIGKSYKKQSEQIEKIRLEWLEKARKEPPYDVFISFKDSDREHGLERTEDSVDAQDLYNALVAEGFKVFFSRISLRNKISEQYEPYIYNAIKTAKVMIVFGEKAEYFNSVWIKNEWNRFRFRIENGEKHKNSLVVVYKNMDPGELPVALKTRQCLNAAEMTFLPDLLRHIKRVVEESEQAMHIERVEIKGGQISKRASKIANETIATREIGEGASAETNISEKQKLDLVKSYIKGKEWRDAADLLEHILFDHPTYAEAIWLTLAVKYNVVSDAELIKRLPRFTDADFFQIEKILNCATKGFAAHLLNLLYDCHSEVDSATYHRVVKTVLPYNYENRGEKIDLIFERAIQMHDVKLFKLALSTMDSNEVDRYIDYNLRYAENARPEEKLECLNAVLDVDNGNARALALRFESIRQDAKFAKLRECFEDMLKYSADPQKVVLNTLSSWVNFISTSDHCQFAMQLLKYYDGELSELKDIMILMAGKMLERGFFEDANRIYKLILTFDPNNAQAFWGICLVKTKSKNEKEIVISNVSIKGLPEYTKYLTLVDEKRRQDCMSIAKKQAARQKAQKRKKTVRLITALCIFLVISAIVTVYVVLPNIEKQNKYDSAIELFDDGEYSEANEIFASLENFRGSQKYVAVINGIQYLEDGRAHYLDQGIRTILTAGVSVKVQFDVENGGFPKGDYTSGGYDSGINFLSAAKRPRITNLSAGNGSNVVEVTYSNLDQFNGLEVAGRNGYSFIKWLVEDYSYTDGQPFELKLKAQWTLKDYSITYGLDGGAFTSESVPYSYRMDSQDIKLPIPSREGYDFIGWSGTGLSKVTIDVTVPHGSYGDKKYVAQWKAHEFTATLDANGGSLDQTQTTVVVEYGSIPNLPTPTRTGYTFEGWFAEDVKYGDSEW
ncbi:MAG: InlB B-repeat-containing protein, partial [Clostridia bacterium]|nr:InlB B-repeat-containing protein [Clostridia bacterium]